MNRNLRRRVEAVVPVTDPELQARLEEVLQVNLADDVLAWELGPDAVWTKVPTTEGSRPTPPCRSAPVSAREVAGEPSPAPASRPRRRPQHLPG
jgi:polyphosphate kinase